MQQTKKGDHRSLDPSVGCAVWVNQLERRRQPPGASTDTHLLPRDLGHFTSAVRAGSKLGAATGAVGTPIYQNSTFILGDDRERTQFRFEWLADHAMAPSAPWKNTRGTPLRTARQMGCRHVYATKS